MKWQKSGVQFPIFLMFSIVLDNVFVLILDKKFTTLQNISFNMYFC